MIIPIGLHVALLAVSALTTGVLGWYGWRHRAQRGAVPFGGLMAGFTIFSLAHLTGLLTIDPSWRLVWEHLQWTALAMIPVFWLVFALEYTGFEEVLSRTSMGVLMTVPMATIVLTWTNPVHGLMWSDSTIVVVEGLAILEQPFGPWAILFSVVSYGMLVIGGLLLLRLVWLSETLYASQALLLIIGIGAPIIANVLTIFGVTPIREPTLDITPYAFSITGLAFGYALFHHHLFDLVPATHRIGRDDAIRGLEDGIVIVDSERRVIYCNPEAGNQFGCDPSHVLGEPVGSLVDDSLLSFETKDAFAELEREDVIYEVRTSPIHDRYGRQIGHTLVIQDVTERKRRERRLTSRREELERLADLNAVIRGVNRALVSATDRAEIEQAVCEHLAESDLYRAACAGDISAWRGEIDRLTAAGAVSDNFDLPEVIDVEEVGIDDGSSERFATIRDDAEGSWTLVPITYGNTLYGALGLESAQQTETTTDRETEILTELGELIGHAINAVEHRRLLTADSVVELEFQSTDTEGTLLGAVRAADCRLEMTGIVPNGRDGHLTYLQVKDGSPVDLANALAAREVADARPIRTDGPDETNDHERNGGLLECTITGETLLGTLLDNGAKVQEFKIDVDKGQFLAEVASDMDVRSLVRDVRDTFPGTQLAAKRERNRSLEQAGRVPGKAVPDLTDRQQAALEAAYRAGYFNWPRESTAEEVAETLDIAAPTLHAHLRKAESSVLADLFDRDGHRSIDN